MHDKYESDNDYIITDTLMDESEKKKKNQSFGCLVFLVISILVLAIVVNGIKSINKEKEICTEPVTAVIAEYSTTTSGTRKHRKVTTTVLYRFEYNGKKYSVESNQYDSKTLHKGNTVEILIDPDDPEHIFVEADAESSLIVGYICIGIFGAAAIGGIFVAVALKRKRKNNDSNTDY